MIVVWIFSVLSAAGATCDDVYWAENTYRDLNAQGQIVEKVDLFKLREWSRQSQFDSILIEKNRDLLLNPKMLKSISITVDGRSTNYAVREWSDNSDYYEIVGFNLRDVIKRMGLSGSGQSHRLGIALNSNMCKKTIDVKID